jgi:hypothetical protein
MKTCLCRTVVAMCLLAIASVPSVASLPGDLSSSEEIPTSYRSIVLQPANKAVIIAASEPAEDHVQSPPDSPRGDLPFLLDDDEIAPIEKLALAGHESSEEESEATLLRQGGRSTPSIPMARRDSSEEDLTKRDMTIDEQDTTVSARDALKSSLDEKAQSSWKDVGSPQRKGSRPKSPYRPEGTLSATPVERTIRSTSVREVTRSSSPTIGSRTPTSPSNMPFYKPLPSVNSSTNPRQNLTSAGSPVIKNEEAFFKMDDDD